MHITLNRFEQRLTDFLRRARDLPWRLRAVLVSALLACSLSGVPVWAMAAKPKCPAVWDTDLAQVRSLIEDARFQKPIFVSRAGEVFGCLGMVEETDDLVRPHSLEATVPIDRDSALSRNSLEWPVNVCAVRTSSWPGLNPAYFGGYLPDDPDILEMPSCEERILNGIRARLSG